MRSFRRSAVGLTALAAVSVLAACSSSDDGSSATHTVKVLMIGYNEKESLDPTTGATIPGTDSLEEAFENAHPDIDLQIINIPWGSGATGYQPKTEAMIENGESCLYEMPAAQAFGSQGKLVNLDTMIADDSAFTNVWGDLDNNRSWGPENPKSLFYLPNNTGIRVINWDSKLFADYGVAPLSQHPTLDEIEEKAAKLTGTDPVTGQQTYGYWYQGKYAVWQFQAIAHAMGATWGEVNGDGSLTVNWDTPEYLAALEWFVKMSKYAPAGALASDAMPEGFLTDQNVVAIIPEGEQGYFVSQLIAAPELRDRFRSSFNFVGPDGFGGLNSVSPLAMAAGCEDKEAGWTALKWLAGSTEAEKFYFEAVGRIPAIEGAEEAAPQIAELPDAEVILGQALQAEAVYPWASSQPRWSLQTALEGALAGTLTPKQALEQAQRETQDWLSTQ
jgi:ABC-type glycerol-3-phosphate transport system substrate-binding protein